MDNEKKKKAQLEALRRLKKQYTGDAGTPDTEVSAQRSEDTKPPPRVIKFEFGGLTPEQSKKYREQALRFWKSGGVPDPQEPKGGSFYELNKQTIDKDSPDGGVPEKSLQEMSAEELEKARKMFQSLKQYFESDK